jgi:hypothetical protein
MSVDWRNTGWTFNTGAKGPNLGNIYYNNPSNWDVAYNQVLNGLGGQTGSNPYRWLQGQSGRIRANYGNALADDPYLNVSDFLNNAIGGLGDLYNNATASSKGQQPSMYRPGRVLY